MANFVRLTIPMKVDGRMRNPGDVVQLPSSLATALCRPGKSNGASRLRASELAAARKESDAQQAQRRKDFAAAKKKEAAKKPD